MRRPRARVAGALVAAVVAAASFNGAATASTSHDRSVATDQAKRWTDADFWGFVDRRQADVEPQWREDLGVYMPAGSTEDVRMDANMLLVHADAALAGHAGPARHDDRVIRLADVLTRPPALLAPPNLRTGTQAHAPGWSSSTVASGAQHVAVDPQVAGALVAAWQARGVVGMSQQLSDRIVVAINDVAASSFFRYPAMLLNQWNWHGDMAAFAARVTGKKSFLDDYRAQLVRFVQGARSGIVAGRTPFLNAGLGLIYSPRRAGATGAAVLSAPEYENLIFSGLRHYDWAVSQGMAPLPAADEQLLREWSQRVLFGDWTHAGALNWDTSLGTRRWWLARYWAFAQQGLGTLATADRLAGGRDQPAWAAWTLQRSLETYEHLAAAFPGGRLPSGLWGIDGREVAPQADPTFTASRVAATAAELAVQRFGSRRSTRPPGWFAYDRDAQRLAVSTPAYSTAVLLQHPSDDYGGIELARLFDGEGDPVSGTGGGRRSAFGIDLNVGGAVRLDTQPGKRVSRRGGTVLTVTDGGRPARRGPFAAALVATGSVANDYGAIRVRTRFSSTAITVERRVRAARSGTATVRLPVWGAKATAEVVRERGAARRLTGRSVTVDGPTPKSRSGKGGKRAAGKAVKSGAGAARGLLLRAERGGYAAAVCAVPKGARLRIVTVPASSTSTRTRRVALLSFPVRARRAETVRLRIVPTTGVPTRDALACR